MARVKAASHFCILHIEPKIEALRSLLRVYTPLFPLCAVLPALSNVAFLLCRGTCQSNHWLIEWGTGKVFLFGFSRVGYENKMNAPGEIKTLYFPSVAIYQPLFQQCFWMILQDLFHMDILLFQHIFGLADSLIGGQKRYTAPLCTLNVPCV